jgi:hypothetical protein
VTCARTADDVEHAQRATGHPGRRHVRTHKKYP